MDSTSGKKSGLIAILSDACALNLPLDLRIAGDKSSGYRSRFLKFDEDPTKPVLLIEAPTSKGSVVPVRIGQEAKVSFSHNDRNHSFESKVLERGKFKLSPKVAVPSLELLVPEEISYDEKRNYYRVLVTDTPPIELNLGVFAEEESGPWRIRFREKGQLTDVGGGGLGFRISEGRSLLLDPGTRLMLSFRLPDEEEQIRALGRICFSIRRPELREAFFGVQFIELDTDIEYKQGADRILRFVAEQQRQSLGKRIRIDR